MSEEKLKEENTRLSAENDHLRAEVINLQRMHSVIAENLPHPIFVMDHTGRYIDTISNKAHPGWGLSQKPSFPLRKNVRQVLPEPAAKERIEYLQLALSSQESIEYEYQQYEHSLGEERRYSVTIIPYSYQFALVSIRDVTSRHKQLERFRKRIRTLEQQGADLAEKLEALGQEYQKYKDDTAWRRLKEVLSWMNGI